MAQTHIGIITKWVNFGSGWRPRVFVVEKGVVTYYKTNKVDLDKFMKEHPDGSVAMIGAEIKSVLSQQRARRGDKEITNDIQGQVGLNVSTIRASSADSKKFYIEHGTGTLQCYASNANERQEWINVLSSTNGGAGRNHSVPARGRSTTRAEKNGVADAMERLQKSAASAEDVGFVMSVFQNLQAHMKKERKDRKELLAWLRTLQQQKKELEQTVIASDAQLALNQQEFQELIAKLNSFEIEGFGDESDEEDDDDEDVDMFFDAEIDLPRVTRSNSLGDRLMTKPMPSNQLKELDDLPRVERRKVLPPQKAPPPKLSLFGLLKEAIGKDLSRITLPVYFNEPMSGLQKAVEDLEYTELLDAAAVAGKGSVERILNLAAFNVSGYSNTLGRTSKPFNPLLAETFEMLHPEKGLRFIGEKVCHHPTILAGHCEGRAWTIDAQTELKTKFWGAKLDLHFKGVPRITFYDGEVFEFGKVTTSIHNIIIGKTYVDHHGSLTIRSLTTGISCKLVFSPSGTFTKSPHQVKGNVINSAGESLAHLYGTWSKAIYCDLNGETLLWEKHSKISEQQRIANWGYWQVQLNEIIPEFEPYCPTDCRLRPDQRHAEVGEWPEANAEKIRIEEKQRAARKQAKADGIKFKPRWFDCTDGETYRYKGGYWEQKAAGTFTDCRDIY